MTHWTNDATKLAAHKVLDDVAEGIPVSRELIRWALKILGDA